MPRLRAWSASCQNKALVTAYPFQGDRLFGDSLEKILVETCDKTKAMPDLGEGWIKGPSGTSGSSHSTTCLAFNRKFGSQHGIPDGRPFGSQDSTLGLTNPIPTDLILGTGTPRPPRHDYLDLYGGGEDSILFNLLEQFAN